MTFEDNLTAVRSELRLTRQMIQDELRAYPTPVSGCDAQYNYLIGLHGSVSEALNVLDAPRFVATPRTPSPTAGVESR